MSELTSMIRRSTNKKLLPKGDVILRMLFDLIEYISYRQQKDEEFKTPRPNFMQFEPQKEGWTIGFQGVIHCWILEEINGR